MRPDLRTEAEMEASPGEPLQVMSNGGGGHGCARERDRDRRAKVETGRALGRQGEGKERVVVSL
jgi:N-methylhydantoinase B/oxoprolinase/acetone carboxylase alpha subunit